MLEALYIIFGVIAIGPYFLSWFFGPLPKAPKSKQGSDLDEWAAWNDACNADYPYRWTARKGPWTPPYNR